MYNNNTNTSAVQPQQTTYASAYQQYMGNRPIYQMPTQQMQPYMGIKGRPVASIEEARASIIDFDGSIFYFPDLANKRIYTKQINMDGTALLNMYELKEIPQEQEFTPTQYITREEFESVISQLHQSLATTATPQPVPAEKPVSKPAGAGVALNF